MDGLIHHSAFPVVLGRLSTWPVFCASSSSSSSATSRLSTRATQIGNRDARFGFFENSDHLAPLNSDFLTTAHSSREQSTFQTCRLIIGDSGERVSMGQASPLQAGSLDRARTAHRLQSCSAIPATRPTAVRGRSPMNTIPAPAAVDPQGPHELGKRLSLAPARGFRSTPLRSRPRPESSAADCRRGACDPR